MPFYGVAFAERPEPAAAGRLACTVVLVHNIQKYSCSERNVTIVAVVDERHKFLLLFLSKRWLCATTVLPLPIGHLASKLHNDIPVQQPGFECARVEMILLSEQGDLLLLGDGRDRRVLDFVVLS